MLRDAFDRPSRKGCPRLRSAALLEMPDMLHPKRSPVDFWTDTVVHGISFESLEPY